MTLPDGAAPPGGRPVVVLLHGGFWRARYSLRLEDDLVADLAGRGYAVWNLEYRGLGVRSGGGWPATFEDVAAGIDELDRLDAALDLARVHAIGHSAGGQLALWAAGRSEPEPRIRLAGAVSQAGVVDLREADRLGISNGAVRALIGGPPGKLPERYDAASPIEHLPIGVPTLLVHGTEDDAVPHALSRTYAKRAGEAQELCELVTLPGVGHMEHLDPRSSAWAPVVTWLEAMT